MKWPRSFVSAEVMTFDVDGEVGWIGIDQADAHSQAYFPREPTVLRWGCP
jgi:hypothetical protein